jgi:hypothetical protein
MAVQQEGHEGVHDDAVVATRSYFLEGESERPILTVTIGRPEADRPGYFRCAYSFSGAFNWTHFAAGVDEIHSLISALAMAGTDLSVLNEESYGGKLRWEAGSADASLPTIRDHWPFKLTDATGIRSFS